MAYIPDMAIDRMYSELTSGARDLYTFLCRCRNQKTAKCCPSISTTQDALKLSRARVFALRKELIDKNWARFDGNNATWLCGFDNEEDRPEVETGGLLYVISDGAGRYKIGQTTNLAHRLATLSTGMPVDPIVTISYHVANARAEERAIHRRFASQQLKREWYALSDGDLTWIKARSLENGTPAVAKAEDSASLIFQTPLGEAKQDTPSLEIETDNDEKVGVINFPVRSLENKTANQSQKQDGQSRKQDPASQKQDSHVRKNQQREPAKRESQESTLAVAAIDNLAAALCGLYRIPDTAGWKLKDKFQHLAIELHGIGATVVQVQSFYTSRQKKPGAEFFVGDFVAWRASQNGNGVVATNGSAEPPRSPVVSAPADYRQPKGKQ